MTTTLNAVDLLAALYSSAQLIAPTEGRTYVAPLAVAYIVPGAAVTPLTGVAVYVTRDGWIGIRATGEGRRVDEYPLRYVQIA